MTGMEQGQNMEALFFSPWFWLGILLAGIFSAGLAIFRRRNRRHTWYGMQLPVIVAIGVGGVLLCMAAVVGLLQTVALFTAFGIAGLVQWYECVTWTVECDRINARTEAHHDPTKEMA